MIEPGLRPGGGRYGSLGQVLIRARRFAAELGQRRP
jgi:hypothetical protein